MSSRQLQEYLHARFVDGMCREDACFTAGLSAGEAALVDRDVERGEQPIPNSELPRQGIPLPTAGGGSNRAHAASSDGREHPPGGAGDSTGDACEPRQPQTEGDGAMARGKKKDDEEVVAVKQPDFGKAKRIFLNDIKPAEEKNAKARGDLSAAWKAIQDDCNLNKAAAKLLHKLNGMSEETRDDYLRTLYGGMKAFGIGISRDLVDQMNDADAPEMPIVDTKGLGVTGLAAGGLQ